MAEKGKSFHFTPNFCTEATLSFFQKKDGKRNEHLEFKVWHRDDKGGDAAGNNQERVNPPGVPWMVQGRVSSQPACDVLTRGSELQSQLTFLCCLLPWDTSPTEGQAVPRCLPLPAAPVLCLLGGNRLFSREAGQHSHLAENMLLSEVCFPPVSQLSNSSLQSLPYSLVNLIHSLIEPFSALTKSC